jgi:hypothetical protein
MERQRRITITTSELTRIKKLQGSARVEIATPEPAVTLTDIGSRTIQGWIERVRMQFIKTTEAQLLICLDSLRAPQAESS